MRSRGEDRREPGTPAQRGRIGRFRDDAARERFLTAYDHALASWPAAPTHLDVETGYGPTHVLSCGSGPGGPIVLLHGVAVSSPSWFASVGALSETHRVFAIDSIGDAGRSTQTAPVRSGDDMSRWLDEVLAGLGVDRVHLIGLSYGGWLALNQASRSPDRLLSVTAVDPIGAIGRPSTAFMIKIVPDSVLALAKSDRAIHRLLRRLNNGTTPAQPLLDLSMTGLRSYLGKQPFPKRLTDDDLRAIVTPTLVLLAERSPVNRVHQAVARARDLLANVETDVVPDTGHMVPVERPALFTDRVLRFIDEHSDPTP
jgi:pimeloyl-ACP methyl ester carboxylesterase